MTCNRRVRLLNLFIETLNEFLHNINEVYKHNTLALMKSCVSVYSSIDPQTICHQFIQYTEPYRDLIVNKDYDAIVLIAKNEQTKQDSYIQNGINDILLLWVEETTDDSKDEIHKYIDLLMNITDRYTKTLKK